MMVRGLFGGVCSGLLLLVVVAGGGTAVAAITLTPTAIGFHNPISVDFHQPTNQVILSSNYPTGDPFNFELVSADGARTQFSSVSGLIDEVYVAAARTTHAGFIAGELFTGTGVAGQVARISPDGSSVLLPWVVLPGETGLLRGALHMDEIGVFGGDLLVATDIGSVWRIDAAGNPTNLGSAGVALEGLAVIPLDARYGPWAGKAVSCNEDGGGFFAFDPSGPSGVPVLQFDLGIPSCENLTLIPPNQFYYAVDFGGQTLWSGSPDQFRGMVGDILVGEEFPGNIWRVRWNPATATFDKELEVTVTQLEGAAFAPVALPVTNHPPTITCPAPETICARACGAPATVSVSVADADGDPLTVSFTVAGTTTTHLLAAGATQDTFTFLAPVGTTAVAVQVQDPAGAAASCSAAVTVKRGHEAFDKGFAHRGAKSSCDDDDDRDDHDRDDHDRDDHEHGHGPDHHRSAHHGHE